MKLTLIFMFLLTTAWADHHEEKAPANMNKAEKAAFQKEKTEAKKKMFEESKKMLIDIKQKQIARHQKVIDCAEAAKTAEDLRKCRKLGRMAREELQAGNADRRAKMKEMRQKMREKLRAKKQGQQSN